MMLIFLIFCAFFTIYTLQEYVVTGTHSRTHRLLPLLMGLIAVYNFYQIIQNIIGENALIAVLKDLLLVQGLFLMIYYVLNFLHIKFPRILETGFLLSLFYMDCSIIWHVKHGTSYVLPFFIVVTTYLLIILSMVGYAHQKLAFSAEEGFVNGMLYLAILIPGVCCMTRFTEGWLRQYAMSIAFLCSCSIMLYLIKTEQLIDTTSLLHENLFDKSDIPVILFGADFFYLESNHAAKQLFPQLTQITRSRDYMNPYIYKIQKLSRMPNKEIEVELWDRYFQCKLSPQYSSQKLIGYIVSVYEITKQKQETQLMELHKEEAEKQNIQKGRFLARMSHDLRSPMHSIIEISDILSQKKDMTEHNRSLILHVKRAGETLLELINTILEYSKLESDKLELNERLYDLERIVEDLSRMSVVNLQSKPVFFSAKICGEHPREFIGDDLRVREIIQNLLSNAVKFTQRGEIRCEITCKVCEENKAYITCDVTDTGVGMKKEALKRIFDEYVTFDRDRMSESSGLGLCIVKQLAELMGGEVHADSDGVSGFHISVSFYQTIGNSTLYPESSYTSEQILYQSTDWSDSVNLNWIYPKARILVADDMRINREIFYKLVEPSQCITDYVSDGKELLAAVKKQDYQLIFIDQVMPGMSGLEAAKELFASGIKTPLIAMTADISGNVRKECIENGFTDFMLKPFSMSDLQIILEKYIPKEYREIPDKTQKMSTITYYDKGETYKKVLETFIREISELEQQLEEYAENNLETFRVKVHGIKGVCRQIGKTEIAEYAEILEMAAKTSNITFIREHLEQFQSAISYMLKEVQQEADCIAQEDITDSAPLNEEELWKLLKDGFDQYDLDMIDKALRQLSECDLSKEQYDILNQAEAFRDDLEYEKGSKLLS